MSVENKGPFNSQITNTVSDSELWQPDINSRQPLDDTRSSVKTKPELLLFPFLFFLTQSDVMVAQDSGTAAFIHPNMRQF